MTTKTALSPEKEYIMNMPDEQVKTVFQLAKNLANARSATDKKSSAYKKLESLVGLTETKEMLKKIISYNLVMSVAAARGRKTASVCNNMCFVGNPGTAKTTVARLLAQILREYGILSRNKFVEAGRADLVGEYSGHTAVKVREQFKKAAGGVLFIDEAYSLLEDRRGGFGDEAINTLTMEMENHRHDTIVILAGYPEKMQSFLESNPGLKSRVPFIVSFPDYTVDELCRISEITAKDSGYELAPDVRSRLADIFEVALKQSDFGNGRYARTLVEQAQLNRAAAVYGKDLVTLSNEELFQLRADDFTALKDISKTFTKKSIGFA